MAAFILSLIGGIFIHLGSGMMTMLGWSNFCGITGGRNESFSLFITVE
jgi:hypothetical protein